MTRSSRMLTIIGIVMLVIMAGFHGSGFWYVRKSIQSSDASDFLKNIVPALFAHPSFHLLALAAFGVLALFQPQNARPILYLVSLLVLGDAMLGFALGGLGPGLLLVGAATCFGLAGFRQKG